MWQRILKLTIAMALAGGASAQQNDKDAQKLRDEERAKAAAQDLDRLKHDEERLQEQAAQAQRQRALTQLRQAQVQEEMARARAAQDAAEVQRLAAQDLAGVRANPNWAR